MKWDYPIEPGDAGKTLAAVVRTVGDLPWSKAKRLVEAGKVELDGALVTDPARRVEPGSRVSLNTEAPRRRRGALDPDRIVYCDGDVVVVNKPPRLLSVPYSAGDKDTLADLTFAALRRGSRPQRSPLGVVQRLDKDTSGLLVFARHLSAKRALSAQLRVHTVTRRYLAIVHGAVHGAAEATRFDTYLLADRGDGLRGSFGAFRRATGKPPREARRAITHARLLERLQGASLVECRLETGRQHQIRIHLSEAGHPLLGEPVYIRDFTGARLEAPRPMLHAETLGFEHPRSGERMEFVAVPPEDFQATLTSLALPS